MHYQDHLRVGQLLMDLNHEAIQIEKTMIINLFHLIQIYIQTFYKYYKLIG